MSGPLPLTTHRSMTEFPRAPATPQSARRRLIQRLAWMGAALMLLIVALSAFMRLHQSGLGCADWPACYGQILSATPVNAAPDPAVASARATHRIAASAMLLLALALPLLTLPRRPRLAREGKLSLGVLAMTLWLAALGVVSRGSTLPAVVLGNLLGGFITLALCVRLAAVAGDAPAPSSGLRRWARLALGLVLLQAILGGLVSATFSATACGSWSDCASIAQSTGWDWSMLNPWLAPTADALGQAQPRGAWLQWLHRAGAVVLLAATAAVVVAALASRRRALALGLAGLLGLQLTLGLLLTPASLPLAQVLLHNLATALLLALLARLV